MLQPGNDDNTQLMENTSPIQLVNSYPSRLHFATPVLASHLAGTSLAVVFNVDVNRVIEVAAEFFRLLLGESVSGNHYGRYVSKRL